MHRKRSEKEINKLSSDYLQQRNGVGGGGNGRLSF